MHTLWLILQGMGLFSAVLMAVHLSAYSARPKAIKDATDGVLLPTRFYLVGSGLAVIIWAFWIKNGWIAWGAGVGAGVLIGIAGEKIYWRWMTPEKTDAWLKKMDALKKKIGEAPKRRTEATGQRRESEIKKRLAAIETELAAVQDRIERAGQSSRDADLANMIIGVADTALGLRSDGSDQTMVRERKLKTERAALKKELQQVRKTLKEAGNSS